MALLGRISWILPSRLKSAERQLIQSKDFSLWRVGSLATLSEGLAFTGIGNQKEL